MKRKISGFLSQICYCINISQILLWDLEKKKSVYWIKAWISKLAHSQFL